MSNHENLIPGPKGDVGRKPWDGPEEDWFQGFLDRVAGGANAVRIVKSELDVAYDTFLAWMRRGGRYQEFHAAIMARVEGMMFEVLEIADDQEADVYTTDDGREVTNTNVIQRAKLRVDTRYRVMQSMDVRFRPKQEITHNLDLSKLSEEELESLESVVAKLASES